jgi:hypothetical protein
MHILIVKLTLTLAMLDRSVNIFTTEEVWILLFAAMFVLVILALYVIKERSNIKQRQHLQNRNNDGL